MNPNLPGELYLTMKSAKMLVRTKSVRKSTIVSLSTSNNVLIVGPSISFENDEPFRIDINKVTS